DAPGQCAPDVVEGIEGACRSNQLRFRKMVSRAYHDSLFMSRIAPTGMIFIPCREGISHRPDEYASPEAISNGTRVLAHVLAELASRESCHNQISLHANDVVELRGTEQLAIFHHEVDSANVADLSCRIAIDQDHVGVL